MPVLKMFVEFQWLEKAEEEKANRRYNIPCRVSFAATCGMIIIMFGERDWSQEAERGNADKSTRSYILSHFHLLCHYL